MRKIKILFITFVVILLSISIFSNVKAKYVLTKSAEISYSTSDYYFEVSVDKTEVKSFPTTVNVTVKNNDGTNFTDADLVYNVSIESQDCEIEVKETTGTLTGGSNEEKTFSVIIVDKQEFWQTEEVKLKFDITTPYKDTKEVTIKVGNSITEDLIGDYVDYTYDAADDYALSKEHSGRTIDRTIQQTTGLQWRILGINDDGDLELVSATPTSLAIYLNGSTGYNNAIYLLNDICAKQYSNAALGVTARSLTIDDIEKQYSDEGKNARDTYSPNVIYGDTQLYESGYDIYPTLYAEEALSGVNGSIRTGGIGKNDPYYTSKESLSVAYDSEGKEVSTSKGTIGGKLVVTQTYYGWNDTPSSYFKNENFYDIIFGTGSFYWVASRCTSCRADYAFFGVHSVNGLNLNARTLFYSDGTSPGDTNAYLRPVVTIDSSLLGRTKNENGAWNLTQNK